jgi:Calcineurin-like phosphoesterase
VSVYLVGDAGVDGSPLFAALEADVRKRVDDVGASHVAVIFLGDNVYPRGIEPKGSSAVLRAQADAANIAPGVQIFFVAGNHDWDQGRQDGLDRVRRETELVDAMTDNVYMLPGWGCPGPVARNLGRGLRVIALDTQWWLHPWRKPKSDQCQYNTKESVEAALTGLLNDDAGGRQTIVVAHHPFVSGGSHGNGRTSPQDYNNAVNLGMRTSMQRAIRAAQRQPLAWVSGHEHTLEVLKGNSARYLVVSGAGKYGDTEPVTPRVAPEGTWLFPTERRARPVAGFMRLDTTRSGAPARLGVFELSREDRKTLVEVYSLLME